MGSAPAPAPSGRRAAARYCHHVFRAYGLRASSSSYSRSAAEGRRAVRSCVGGGAGPADGGGGGGIGLCCAFSPLSHTQTRPLGVRPRCGWVGASGAPLRVCACVRVRRARPQHVFCFCREGRPSSSLPPLTFFFFTQALVARQQHRARPSLQRPARTTPPQAHQQQQTPPPPPPGGPPPTESRRPPRTPVRRRARPGR